MYNYIHPETVTCLDTISYWKDVLIDLDTTYVINYIEIGSLHGGSLLHFHNTFGQHVRSISIDPFSSCDNYIDYNEHEHEKNFEIYKINTEQLGNKNIHIRKPSFDVLPLLKDNFYDVVYVDGNYNLSNLLEDCVLSYRKLKPNGYLIINNIDCGESYNNTYNTVVIFIKAYVLKMDLVYLSTLQAVLKKK